MPRKSKPRNPLTFRTNAEPSAKRYEIRKVNKGREMQKK